MYFMDKYLRGEKMTREDFNDWVRIVGQVIDEKNDGANTYAMIMDIDVILAGIFDHDRIIEDN